MSDAMSWESKFRTREISPWEWEKIKDVFEELYIEQGQTLKMIRQHLAEEHGFYANETQYKKKIRKWDIQKNLSRDKMVAVVRLLDHRTAKGLSTMFSFNGKQLSHERIDRSRKRFNLPGPDAPIQGEIQYEIEGVEYWDPEADTLASPPDPQCLAQPEPQASAQSALAGEQKTQSPSLLEVRVPVHEGVAYVAQAEIPTTRNAEQDGDDGAAYQPPDDDEFYAKPSSEFAPVNTERLNQASKRRCNDSDAGDAVDNRKSRRTSRNSDNGDPSDVLAQPARVIENSNREENESSSMPVSIPVGHRGSLASTWGELGSPGLGFQVLSICSAGSPSPEPLPSGPILSGGSPPLPPQERRDLNISLPSFSQLEACSSLPPPRAGPVSSASPPPPVRWGTGPPSPAVAWGPGQPPPPTQRKSSILALAPGQHPAPISNGIDSSKTLHAGDFLESGTILVPGPVGSLGEPIARSPEDGPLSCTGQESHEGTPRDGYIPRVAGAGESGPESQSPPSLMSLASVLSSPSSPRHSPSLPQPPHHDSPSPELAATPLQVPTSQEVTKWVSAATRYSTKSWWNDLQELEVRGVRNLTNCLGRNHPDTLGALSALATLYTTTGKDTKARELHKYVYDELHELFGSTHPRTITAQHNLAGVYLAQGDYPAALTMAKEAAEHCKTVHGADHAETLSSLVQLGHAVQIANSVAEAQQRKPEAKKLLGILLEKKGCHRRSKTILEEVLIRQEELFGKGHPETLSVMDSLGTAYLSLGEPAKSEEILRRAVDLSTEKLGGRHPDTLSSKHNLVNALLTNGNFSAAKDLAGTVYAETRQVLGDEHVDTAISMVNQASALMGLGDVPGAVHILRATVDKLAVILPAGNSQVLMVKEKLARGLLDSFRLPEAERVMREVLVERRCALGDTHPETVRVKEWLGMCRARMRGAEVGGQGGGNAAIAAAAATGEWMGQEGVSEGPRGQWQSGGIRA
ncbi:TPR-like protein [Tuber magnatum]|uniref:TPR-like protein n=1 Tax=Tuber magnatum TaxID=42249 RepID=A0A317SND1_9PEZI|nr:TPR-like protein [Tuber magnatum]